MNLNLKKKRIFSFFSFFLIISIIIVHHNTEKQIDSKMIFQESFQKEQSILKEKGYTTFEINQIYEYMSEKNIKKILASDYVDMKEFFGIPNFDFDKLENYKAYQALENIPMKDAVTKVNLKRDIPFYTEIEEIKNPDSPLILVNKTYYLNEFYIPKDLVAIPSFPELQLRKIAIDDFENLLAKAKLENIYLIPYSTFRSYSYQKEIYEKYLAKDPKEKVDTYSARPGHSEHQTGLAIDIRSINHWYNLTPTDQEWMKKNASQFGFIIRYQKNHSDITGYKEEPWHIRYVGKEVAQKIQNLNISFEEYYDIYSKEH